MRVKSDTLSCWWSYNPFVRTKNLKQRYVGTPLYEGDLMDETRVKWLRHDDQPRGLAFPCMLPGCRRMLMRTSYRRQAYYCTGHARIALDRQRQLTALIAALEAELDGVPMGPSGRATTRRGRRVQSDLDFVRRILASYATVSEADVSE